MSFAYDSEAQGGNMLSAMVDFAPSRGNLISPNTAGANLPPEITRVETFHEGGLTYFRLNFFDPNNDVVGFGFEGIRGSGWAPEVHLFTNPSYGRVSPGQLEYPFNQPSGTASDVAAYVFDAAGNRSPGVPIHLLG